MGDPPLALHVAGRSYQRCESVSPVRMPAASTAPALVGVRWIHGPVTVAVGGATTP